MENPNISKPGSHELTILQNAEELIRRNPRADDLLIRELDEYIQKHLSSDFKSLFVQAAKVHRVSGLFKSRVLFAYMRSAKEIPAYVDFIKTMCADGDPFCGESYYSRHRKAMALLELCDESVKEFYNDFSEFSLRKIISATRNLSEFDTKKFLSKLSKEYSGFAKPSGKVLEDAIEKITRFYFSDAHRKDASDGNLKTARIPRKISKCQSELGEILNAAGKKHYGDPEKSKRVAKLKRQIEVLIREIEELSGIVEADDTRPLDAASQEGDSGASE